MTAETGTPRPIPGVLPGWEVSHWTSEEVDAGSDLDIEHSKDRIVCPVNLAMVGLGCNDEHCDNVRLFCRAAAGMWTNNHDWTEYFSDEEGTYEGCNSGEFVTGLQCRGQFCDDIRLRCTEHNAIEDFCYVTDPIAEDNPFTEFFDTANGYMRRILCQGDNCDEKRLEICRIKNFPLNLGAFSDLCVTSIAGFMLLAPCESAENEENVSQVWHHEPQVGQLINPITGTCLTAIGGSGTITEELCAEAGDTFWFKDVKGRLSSVDFNNNLLCLGVADMQDPFGIPPIGAAFELATCSDAYHQLFEPSNAALPPPLPEYDAGFGEIFVPALLMPGSLLLIGVVSVVGVSALRRSRAHR